MINCSFSGRSLGATNKTKSTFDTASAGPRATLKYSVGANGEKVLEQEWPVRPLPDGSMGPGDLRIWSWVPRSDH